MTEIPILDAPLQAEFVTAYDEALLPAYLRLLDADAEGADWREAVAIIFAIDADAEPDRARRIHDSHLARARWMAQSGYRLLVGKAAPST